MTPEERKKLVIGTGAAMETVLNARADYGKIDCPYCGGRGTVGYTRAHISLRRRTFELRCSRCILRGSGH